MELKILSTVFCEVDITTFYNCTRTLLQSSCTWTVTGRTIHTILMYFLINYKLRRKLWSRFRPLWRTNLIFSINKLIIENWKLLHNEHKFITIKVYQSINKTMKMISKYIYSKFWSDSNSVHSIKKTIKWLCLRTHNKNLIRVW